MPAAHWLSLRLKGDGCRLPLALKISFSKTSGLLGSRLQSMSLNARSEREAQGSRSRFCSSCLDAVIIFRLPKRLQADRRPTANFALTHNRLFQIGLGLSREVRLVTGRICAAMLARLPPLSQ